MNAAAHRARRAAAAIAAVATVTLVAGPHLATTASAQSATHSDTAYLFSSAQGDYIGAGATAAYTPATATIGLGGTASAVTLSVSTATENWQVTLAAPAGQTLSAGTTYSGAQRYPFEPAGTPGLSVTGDGRGCNNDYGSFTVNEIATDASGNATSLDATYTQTCESTTAPPLTGTVRYAAPTTITLTANAPQSAATQPVTYTAAVDGTAGSVTFRDGTRSVGSVPVSGGGAALTVLLGPGTHVVSASYSGDPATPSGTSQPVIATVAPAQGTVTQYSYTSAPGDYIGGGQSATFTQPPATIAVSGTLGAAHARISDSAGDSWNVDLAAPSGAQLAPGTYTNAQRYPFEPAGAPGLAVYGDGRGCNNDYGSFTINEIGTDASGTVTSLDASLTQTCETTTAPPLDATIQVSAPPPAPAVTLGVSPPAPTYGQTVALTAAVGSDGTAGGSVSFYDGATAVGTATVSAGSASLPVSLGAGGHSVTALYGGDGAHAPSTSPPVTFTVSPAATTTTLGATPASPTVAQSVTLTASVTSGAGTPAGTVTFLDAGATLGSSALQAGAAQLTMSFATAGTHALTARYGGDGSHAASTSSVLNVTVSPAATTTSLTASPTQVRSGQSVRLVAGVTSAAGTPAGTVTFRDGSTVLGAVTLQSGSASITVTFKTSGGHSLTAVYGGSAQFAPSTSAPVTVTVKH